jgi:hypothetical protein
MEDCATLVEAMANKKNDPFSDMLNRGKHPFPPDIGAMLEALLLVMSQNAVRRQITDQDFLDWAAGENLDRGRIKLNRLLDDNPN